MSKDKALTLSIVIPAYNEEGYLKACLESIAGQSEAPDEVIVVNNNSTDGTVAIAKRFPFVKLLREKRQGVLFARDKGFNAASGDIIARIDADTRLGKDWVAIVREAFQKFPNDALTGPVGYYDIPLPGNNHRLDQFFRGRIYRYFPDLPFLFGTNMAFSRSDWRRVSGLVCDHREMFEDIDLAIHLFRLGVHCRYYPPMLAGMSARRSNDSPREFNRYLKLFDKTYRDHGFKSLMPRVTRGIYVTFYFLTWPIYHIYDEKTGRYTLSKLLNPTAKRKHPMEEA